MEQGETQISEKRYGRVLERVRYVPRPIRSEAENDEAIRVVESLMLKVRSPEEEALLSLIALLVDDYEGRAYPVPDVPPSDMLRHLSEAKGVRQADIVAALGISKGAVSAVWNGKKGVSKTLAKRLGEYFGVPSDLFI